jgi:putative spermidine/putrescine transport system substrate-binding protein
MNKILAAVLASTLSGAALAADVTVISFGGVSKVVQTEAFYKPFEQASGNKVIAGEYNGEMGLMQAMVSTGNVSWDVVQVEGPELLRGCETGLFERLDDLQLDPQDFLPGTLSECGAGLLVWSMAVAYDAGKLASAPTGWADFWDVQKYPGKRALRKGAKYTLEFALMADGVAPAQVYQVLGTQEGVERAFKKLDEIKAHLQWWESGAQSLQFVAAGDVVMSTTFNGRVFAAQEEGANMGIMWNGSIYSIDSWAVPKGSKSLAAAKDFIALSLSPETQKVHTEKLGYGSTNTKVSALLDPALLPRLNTAPENLVGALQLDDSFWVDHGEDLEERFNAWVAR